MRRALALGALVLLAASTTSCWDDLRPVSRPVPPPAPAPVANTPAGAVRLLEWAWNQRSCEALRGLFTDDYRFVFALGDSSGNAYRDVPWGREDELAASCNVFANATDISLAFDKTLIALPDSRPGKDPRFHKSIRTKVNLAVVIPETSGTTRIDINGFAQFYLVRGDSAAIPPDQAAQGAGPDSTRWWIDRWEDQTLPAGGLRANPTNSRSWGALKVLFR